MASWRLSSLSVGSNAPPRSRARVAQVSRILGHARFTVTLDVYTHLFDHARHAREIRTLMTASPFAALLDTTAAARHHRSRGRAPHCLSCIARSELQHADDIFLCEGFRYFTDTLCADRSVIWPGPE